MTTATGWSTSRRRARLALFLGLLSLAALSGSHLVATSQTSDEAVHLFAGAARWRGDPRWNPEHPPLSKLLAAAPVVVAGAAVPPAPVDTRREAEWPLGIEFLYRNVAPGPALLALGRLPILATLLALGGLLYRAGERRAAGAGALALALLALDPNFLAHGSLVTNDVPFALAATACVLLAKRAADSPSAVGGAALGVASGLALATKFSAAALGPALLAGVPWGRVRDPSWRRGAGIAAGVAAAAAALTVAVAYAPEAPTAWWEGFRGMQPSWRTWFLGRAGDGREWSYFPVCVLVKTPLGHLALIGAAFALAARRGLDRDDVALLGPAVGFFGLAAWKGINIGVRHVLPVYPLLYLFAARTLVTGLAPRSRALVLAPAILVSAASVGARAPHFLAYFNELAGGTAGGARFVADSNLDWGQGLPQLRAWMDREGVPAVMLAASGSAPPEAWGIRYQSLPSSGEIGPDPVGVLPPDSKRDILAISKTNLLGHYLRHPDLYAWLRGRSPIADLAGAMLVYDLTGDEDAHAEIDRVYRRLGRDEMAGLWAEREAARRRRGP